MAEGRQPRTSPTEESVLRELEHSLRNQLWALTMRPDLPVEQVEKLRAELRDRLDTTQKRLADLSLGPRERRGRSGDG